MASDLERAVRWSKRFEGLLDRRYSAQGRGLHQKIDSVEADLDADTVRALRLVATVRNRIVHEENYTRIDDRPRFSRACKIAQRALEPRRRGTAVVLIVGAALLVLAGAVLLFRGEAPFRIF